MNITSLVAGGVIGTIIALGSESNIPEPVINVTNDMAAQLTQACTFYSNVLSLVDQRHFEGKTSYPYEDMAFSAEQAMLAYLYTDQFYDADKAKFDESVIEYADDEKEIIKSLDIGTFTISPATAVAGSYKTYEAQCAQLAPTALKINHTFGTDIFSLFETAINGALHASRDPHTSYLPPVASQKTTEKYRGEFGGLGINVSKSPLGILIDEPIKDTPAEQAGLTAGDIIIKADNMPLATMTIGEAVEVMRGAPGTDIVVTIQRGDAEPFDIKITRAIIAIAAAKTRILPEVDNTAYVEVRTFSDKTVPDIKKDLYDVSGGDITTLEHVILDFRNNPGGLLSAAAMLSDLFISAAHPGQAQRLVANGLTANDNIVLEDTILSKLYDFSHLNIVVLTNRGSASASEILAAALQDSGSEVIGKRTFGKGTVQTITPVTKQGNRHFLPLNPSYAAAKITTSAFFAGRTGLSNQGSGVIPDVLVQYNDIRDQIDEDAFRESKYKNSVDMSGRDRTAHEPDYICSLKAEFSGALSDDTIAMLPDGYTLELRIRDELTKALEPQSFFDADLHCATMRLLNQTDTPYATITPAPK